MARPMQTFKTDDGRTFLIPGDAQRTPQEQQTLACVNLCLSSPQCECHEKMGNDFWFLPTDACLRKDGKCTGGKS